jgi:hypothetical protein
MLQKKPLSLLVARVNCTRREGMAIPRIILRLPQLSTIS